MLHQFLMEERKEILALCAEKVLKSSDQKSSNAELEEGLPLFYDGLIQVLKRAEQETSESEKDTLAREHIGRGIAIHHGEEAQKLGYTLSQVIHGYGCICQGITEYAENNDQPITAREFSFLNLCLDNVIAEAVTAYDRVQRETTESEEVARLGFLVHELRNALSNAIMSFSVIKEGTVGVGGNTSRIVDRAHTRMRDLIDRSLTEVRLRSHPTVEPQRGSLLQLVSEVEAAASGDARAKLVEFSIEVPPTLEIYADHHLLVSALGNLVQNAIKFTQLGSTIWIRASEVGSRVVIEIEDQCGGLSTDKIEELFQLFTQRDADRSGVGLGLAICRRAVSLNGGVLSARDVPGQGCIFAIDLPRAEEVEVSSV
jgi:signal transduction histidine kinase